MCYESTCSKSGSIIVTVGKKNYTCKTAGEQIKLKGMDGYITCPNPVNFCGQMKASCPDDCNLNGRCTQASRCYCYRGFKGLTCEKRGSEGGYAVSRAESERAGLGPGHIVVGHKHHPEKHHRKEMKERTKEMKEKKEDEKESSDSADRLATQP